MRRRTSLAAMLLVATGLAATSCSSIVPSTAGDPVVTIGSLGSTEDDVVAHLYGEMLAENGFTVAYNLGIGGRDEALDGLENGLVDIVADRAGSLLYALAPGSEATTTDGVERALEAALAARDLQPLALSHARDGSALVVTAQFAADNAVDSIDDIVPIAASVALGSGADFEPLAPVLQTGYGLDAWSRTIIDDDAVLVPSLAEGRVQIAELPSTSPAIAENGFVALRDDQQLLVAQNIVPVANEAGSTRAVSAVVDEVSRQLTTQGLAELRATAGTATPRQVARAWLAARGLLG